MSASDRLLRTGANRGSFLGAVIAIFALAILGVTAYIVYQYLVETGAQSAAKPTAAPAPQTILPATASAIDEPPTPMKDRRKSLFDQVAEEPATDGHPAVASALKMVTAHVRDALELRPTLVVWLFDRSASAQQLRERVVGRFAEAYQELAAGGRLAESGKSAGSPPLLSVIAAFGKQIDFLTPEPSADTGVLLIALSGLSVDDSGVENTFGAVLSAAERYRELRTKGGRYVMMVLVTDEVGDDQQRIEPALAMLRRNAIPAYVIGVSAPFGRREAADAADEQTEPTTVVQGPESLEPELTQVDFVNSGSSAAGGDAIDSGLGPYSLSRLCRETGGEYFAIPVSFSGAATLFGGSHAVRGMMYDPAALRRYTPQYLSDERYRKLVAENKALTALIEGARLPRVETRFDWPRELTPKDDARFRRSLDEAQQAPARLMPKIDKLYETLKGGEEDRERLTEPRWQAGFDLAMGRAMAAKARTESFIAMLAVMKQGKSFADPKSTAWTIVRADEISVGSALDRLRQRAGEHLQRVVREHPNTPWADFAKRELSVPMGWKWVEK